MSESTPWILEDEPAPPEAAPRFELPRLQIIHLMMWMAATAAAIVPYRVQMGAIERAGRESASLSGDPVATLWVAYGVTMGALLFVAVAAVVWRMRGYEGRFEPAHYLAFQGAAYWTVWSMALAALQYADANAANVHLWHSWPKALASFMFFFWFLRLAWRPEHSKAWRRAFVVIALAPPVDFVLRLVFANFFWNSFLRSNMYFISVAPTTIVSLLQAAVIAAALLADARRTPARHWSHWLAAVARLVMIASVMAYYVYLMVAAPTP